MEELVGDPMRPLSWDDYVGQDALKTELEVRLQAAHAQNRPLDHLLLTGPPGYGKTSIARIIAVRKGESYISYASPLKPGDLVEVVRNHDGIVFFDELHKWSVPQQEALLPLLEDGWVSAGRGRKVHAEWLTVIAATTERHKVIEPLTQRFPCAPEFDPYTDDEMARIVGLMAAKAGVEISADDALALARAAGGTPRQARHLVCTYRDIKVTTGAASATDVLSLLRIDEDGLTVQHRRYLEALADHCEGGQGGVKVLASLLRLGEGALLDLERLLLQHGFIQMGNRGRLLTTEGYRKLKDFRRAA